MLKFSQRALVIGGNGALGRAMIQIFVKSWNVTSIDFSQNSSASKNILLPKGASTTQMLHLKPHLQGKYDAILCTAGGFGMVQIDSQQILDQTDQMMEINLQPSLLAAHFATNFLTDSGLLMLTGAAAVFNDTTPSLLAYGLSKSAVHFLALNLVKNEKLSSASTVVTILPEMIDTPNNRKAMPDADFSKWTDPLKIAALVKMWAQGSNRPVSGSFAVMKTHNNSVVPEFVQFNGYKCR